MEVNIKISSEDHLIIDNFQIGTETQTIENEKIINSLEENMKENFTYTQNFKLNDYFYNLNKKNNNEYNVELNCKDKIKEEIKSKIKSCEEKEKILNSKKVQFQKMIN